jgi:hypothetical protein
LNTVIAIPIHLEKQSSLINSKSKDCFVTSFPAYRRQARNDRK